MRAILCALFLLLSTTHASTAATVNWSHSLTPPPQQLHPSTHTPHTHSPHKHLAHHSHATHHSNENHHPNQPAGGIHPTKLAVGQFHLSLPSDVLFEQWKRRYNKHYPSEAAERHAFENFQHSVQQVKNIQMEYPSDAAFNEWSDLSSAEFGKVTGATPWAPQLTKMPVGYRRELEQQQKQHDKKRFNSKPSRLPRRSRRQRQRHHHFTRHKSNPQQKKQQANKKHAADTETQADDVNESNSVESLDQLVARIKQKCQTKPNSHKRKANQRQSNQQTKKKQKG